MNANSSWLLRSARTVPRKPKVVYMVTLKARMNSSGFLMRSLNVLAKRLESFTVVSSHAQKIPMTSPKVAVEKPRRVNCFIMDSTMMKNAPMMSAERMPIHILSGPSAW